MISPKSQSVVHKANCVRLKSERRELVTAGAGSWPLQEETRLRGLLGGKKAEKDG